MAVPVQAVEAAVIAFLKSTAGKKLLASLASSAVAGGVSSKNDNDNNAASDDDVTSMTQSEKLDKLRDIMIGTPKDYLIRGAAAAATGISDFIGNKAVTDANRLASAIIAANRTNNAKQNEIYGPSKIENAANVWANEKMRRGENVKNVTDQISNVINKTAGLYSQRDDTLRALQAQEVVQAPGNFYNYLNTLQRANKAVGMPDKNKGGK